VRTGPLRSVDQARMDRGARPVEWLLALECGHLERRPVKGEERPPGRVHCQGCGRIADRLEMERVAHGRKGAPVRVGQRVAVHHLDLEDRTGEGTVATFWVHRLGTVMARLEGSRESYPAHWLTPLAR